ncbi:MAG: hypothetical protein ACE5F1_06385 [Planctomycetota bacterium]
MGARESKQYSQGLVAIVLTLLAWSSVPLFLKHFSVSIDLWTSNGWRYGISGLFWAPLPIVCCLRGRWPEGLLRAAIVPSIVNAIGQVIFVAAHYQIDPGLISFGLRSQMNFAAIGAYLMFSAERPVIRSRGYLIGTSGTLLLGEERILAGHVEGIGLSLFSGLLFAAYGLTVRRYMHGFRRTSWRSCSSRV